MKKLFFIGFAFVSILVFAELSTAPKDKDNVVSAETKDTKLPDWQWTSGQVEIKKIAAKQAFTIVFSPNIYRPRDSVKITFSTYKISMTNLTQGATFGQWKGKMSLVYFINNNWIPIVSDTNDRVNRLFSGKNNNTTDLLTNYSVYFTVPLSRTLTISSSALSLEKDNIYSGINPGGPMLEASINGIEVKKLR